MSQLNDCRDDKGAFFQPVFSELKCAVTADHLIKTGSIRPPDLIKVDVDGNELPVLRGMSRALSGANPPRSVQVEITRGHKDELFDFMHEQGFELAERHDTLAGTRKLSANVDPDSFSYNAVFTRRPSF
jgi:hypothetical protein